MINNDIAVRIRALHSDLHLEGCRGTRLQLSNSPAPAMRHICNSEQRIQWIGHADGISVHIEGHILDYQSAVVRSTLYSRDGNHLPVSQGIKSENWNLAEFHFVDNRFRERFVNNCVVRTLFDTYPHLSR